MLARAERWHVAGLVALLGNASLKDRLLLHQARPIGTVAPSLHRTKGEDHLPNALFRQGGKFLGFDGFHRFPAGMVFLYFLISTYAGEVAEQGVAVARMRWADRNQPVGKVWKWHGGQWSAVRAAEIAAPFDADPMGCSPHLTHAHLGERVRWG